jgi:hypothetical protein
MRKSIVTLVLLALVLVASSFLGVLRVDAAYTPSGGGFPLCSGIAINTPGNSTFTVNNLTLNVSVRGMLSPQIYSYTLAYSIDGKNNISIPVTSTFVPVEATRTYANGTTETAISEFASYYLISGCASLHELNDGTHILRVYARYVRVSDENTNWPKILLDTSTVGFTTDTGTSNAFVQIQTDFNITASMDDPKNSDEIIAKNQPAIGSANVPLIIKNMQEIGVFFSLFAVTTAGVLFYLKKRKHETENR